jgi:hypothetical protein
MRNISVQFASGREVLSSYWGLLDNGGLVLAGQDLSEGDAVLLDVRIKSLKQSYRLAARVVRRVGDDGRAFVAFNEGEKQDLMLNAAWADTHDVPQRKHRRVSIANPFHRPIQYAPLGEAVGRAVGQLLDVSPGGCRLRGDLLLPVGTRIQVITPSEPLEGQVRWTTPGREMGVEFARPERVIEAFLGE